MMTVWLHGASATGQYDGELGRMVTTRGFRNPSHG